MNNIYILVSPKCWKNGSFPGETEYRVAYAADIALITLGKGVTKNTSKKAYGEELDVGLLYELLIFGDSDVFTEKELAYHHADCLQKEEYTNYSIVFITRSHSFVDNITKEEAATMLKTFLKG